MKLSTIVLLFALRAMAQDGEAPSHKTDGLLLKGGDLPLGFPNSKILNRALLPLGVLTPRRLSLKDEKTEVAKSKIVREARQIMNSDRWEGGCTEKECNYRRKNLAGVLLETVVIDHEVTELAQQTVPEWDYGFPSLLDEEDLSDAVKKAADSGKKNILIAFGDPYFECFSCQRVGEDLKKNKEAPMFAKADIFYVDVKGFGQFDQVKLAKKLGANIFLDYDDSMGKKEAVGGNFQTPFAVVLNLNPSGATAGDAKYSYDTKTLLDGYYGNHRNQWKKTAKEIEKLLKD